MIAVPFPQLLCTHKILMYLRGVIFQEIIYGFTLELVYFYLFWPLALSCPLFRTGEIHHPKKVHYWELSHKTIPEILLWEDHREIQSEVRNVFRALGTREITASEAELMRL